MKKGTKRWLMVLAVVVLFVVAVLFMGGCDGTGVGNKTLMDVNYTYNKAIIKLANDEVIEVDIKSWNDYDGEQLQIIAKDGTVYLTNSFRCDLINEKED